MKVCVCCYNPEVIGKLVDCGQWYGSFIILPDDTPTIANGEAVSHKVLEGFGFQWGLQGIGIWRTFYGKACVKPPLKAWAAAELQSLQHNEISREWTPEEAELFYVEWWPYYKMIFDVLFGEQPHISTACLLAYEMKRSNEVFPPNLEKDRKIWSVVEAYKEAGGKVEK